MQMSPKPHQTFLEKIPIWHVDDIGGFFNLALAISPEST
jgi:hypothetical protein